MQPAFDLVGAVADEVERRLRPLLTRRERRWLTMEDAADYLGRTSGAIRKLVSTGKLPVVKLDSRLCFDARDLDRVMEEAKKRS